MRRSVLFCILICFGILLVFFGRTAVDPEDFSGQWYASDTQNPYLFRDGLIYNARYAVPLSGSETVSGAYAYCKDSVLLFAEGIEGLETEKELYLIHKDDGSFLYEHKDGTGKLFFVRYHE